MTLDDFQEQTRELLNRWWEALDNGLGATAVSHCDQMINLCRTVLSEPQSTKPVEVLNHAYLVGVLFGSLRNLVDLIYRTSEPGWLAQPKTVVEVWNLRCNFREGYEIVQCNIGQELTSWILARVERIEKAVFDRYGRGTYVSPEIVFAKPTCSICDLDHHTCAHVGGRIYGGRMCRVVPSDDACIKSVALVSDPIDDRCRIWPWMMKKDRSIREVPIMTSGLSDDFLYSKPIPDS